MWRRCGTKLHASESQNKDEIIQSQKTKGNMEARKYETIKIGNQSVYTYFESLW